MDADVCGIFMVYLETNMQTEQLSRYKYWRWQYINRQFSCPLKSPTYNGNFILKYLSNEAVNFISLSARIGSILPSRRGFKHKTHQKYWKNKKCIHFNAKHLFFPLLLFAVRFVCSSQAGEYPIPTYWETARMSEKCSIVK